jgi:hypothetical protein
MWGLAAGLLGALAACGGDAVPAGTPGGDDLAPDVAADTAIPPIDLVPDVQPRPDTAPPVDVSDPDTAEVGEGAPGDLCTRNEECDDGLCVPLSDDGLTGICSTLCELPADCPEGFSCVLVRSSGRDQVRACLPVAFCLDADADGYGVGPGCQGPDCDDTDDEVNPGRRERCDGRDTSCSGAVDDDPQFGLVDGREVRMNDDCDTGLPGACSAGRWTCEAGNTLCRANTPPASEERCNGLDDTCDGRVDTDADGAPLARPFYRGPEGTEGVGLCGAGREVCEGGAWTVAAEQVLPQPEACDGTDSDCSGVVDDVPSAQLQSDASHCGACGNACRGDEACVAGTCRCTGGGSLCGGACVDTQTSPLHCGACDNACQPGEACLAGACRCPAGQLLCDTVCRDIQSSQEHCGGCNIACTGGRLCDGGACLCPSGQTFCDGQCRDTATSNQHCGACGVVCSGGRSCEGGSCVCPAGQAFCDGLCRDTATSSQHCGGCGNVCPGDQVCQAGTCGCPAGRFACRTSCVAQAPGSSCYTFPTGTPGTGVCTAGTWVCNGDTGTVTCSGQVGPRTRACNGVDDDCNGITDQACPTALALGGTPVVTEIQTSNGNWMDESQTWCPAGAVMTGMRVRIRNCGIGTCGVFTGDRIFGWQPVCAPLSLGARLADNRYAAALGTATPLPITTGDAFNASDWVSTSCPEGQAVVAVGHSFGEGNHLSALRLVCARPVLTGAPGAFQVTLENEDTFTVWRDSTNGTHRCASNGFITGLGPRWLNGHAHALRARCQGGTVTLRP